ncbi:MAG: energy transducer TonB [Acidobacteriota bacterium]
MTARLALLLATSFGVLISAHQASPAGQQTPPTTQQVQPYPPIGPGIQAPTPTHSVNAKYTRDAIQAKIEGLVELTMVVLPDGNVSDVQVTKSLDAKFGLDQQAIDAAKQWRFKPGTKDGRVVPMFVTILMEFRLSARGSPTTPSQTPAAAAANDDFYKDTYLSVYPQLVQPVLLRSSQPKYTSDAMRAKLQGMVEVEAVVGTDGTVTRARVSKSLDTQLGLDQNALDAVKSWVFTPGRLNGQPVPVVVRLTLEFRLH